MIKRGDWMFPERLRALRKGRGLSLPALATQLNRDIDDGHPNTGPQIGSWERGTNTPSYLEVRKLATFFGVSVDYLSGYQPTTVELEDLFVGETQLHFNGHALTVKERTEVYALIKGYLHGRNDRGKRQSSDEVTLPLE
ncbi:MULTISPECIES: helix-turn-helix domain-containing protein [unclassified Ligilactobacillus]|uniref:helix-turn-helix domain-containing protein n=1 Tax=unclassified Ligilactobacillus TaxID=2767920 RepID=UPI003854F7C1